MSGDLLGQILNKKRRRVETAKRFINIWQLISAAGRRRSSAEDHRLQKALTRNDGPNIIAEIKRASPSKGLINGEVDIAAMAKSYVHGGAAAISVLTEEDHFRGSIPDLETVRDTVAIPILRKDFIFDDYQIYESAAIGADAVLLIVAALTSEALKELLKSVHRLGLDALVEVHNADELKIAADAGARIIGVNNRNLRTFEVSLDVSRSLQQDRPDDVLMVTESGLSTTAEVAELFAAGYDGFLIGESLMRSSDPAAEIRNLRAL